MVLGVIQFIIHLSAESCYGNALFLFYLMITVWSSGCFSLLPLSPVDLLLGLIQS